MKTVTGVNKKEKNSAYYIEKTITNAVGFVICAVTLAVTLVNWENDSSWILPVSLSIVAAWYAIDTAIAAVRYSNLRKKEKEGL